MLANNLRRPCDHLIPAGVAEEKPTNEEWLLAGTSVAAALIGLFFAYLLYYKRPELPDRITAKMHGIYMMVLHKYYVDEGYGAIFVKPLLALSTVVLWRGVDQGVIDGLVNGAGAASQGVGNELRQMQSGNIRSYAAWVAIGGAAIVALHDLAGGDPMNIHPHPGHVPSRRWRFGADADAAQ